jgi:hypothetical protein
VSSATLVVATVLSVYLALGCSHGREESASLQLAAVTHPPVTTTLMLSAPNPLSPTAPVLEASNSVTLGPGANVTGTVVSLGGGSVGLKAQPSSTVTGDVWSRALAILRPSVQVGGILHASQTVLGPNVVLGGTDSAPPFDPVSTLTWTVTYPPGTASDVTLQEDVTQALAPGVYGTVTTKHNANLQLSAGTYYVAGLDLGRSSTLTLDPGNGPVIIYVSTDLDIGSTIAPPVGSAAANLFIGYLGTEPVHLGTAGVPFSGALVAPWTSITLLAQDAPHVGFFAASDVVVAPGAPVQYAAPTALVAASTPDLICVANTAPGQYVALFGYNNASDALGRVTVGPNNQFSPGPAGQGQIEDFLPINSPGAFAVAFDGTPLTWTLAGGSAIASAQSPPCPSTACSPTCRRGEQCVGGQCVTECGDALCGGDETCNTCPRDCACQAGSVCVRNSCAKPVTCGVDWQCGSGTSFGVNVDCGACPGGGTCTNHVCF